MAMNVDVAQSAQALGDFLGRSTPSSNVLWLCWLASTLPSYPIAHISYSQEGFH